MLIILSKYQLKETKVFQQILERSDFKNEISVIKYSL